MKKVFGFLLIVSVLFMTSCADSKKFETKDGQVVTVEPYGWFDMDEKVEGVDYKVCVGNVVWSVILSETIVVPIVLTGVALWEPVGLDPQVKSEDTELVKEVD